MRLCLSLLLLLAAGAAFAGEPSVQISRDAEKDAMRVRGSIDIAAPPAVVFAVINDCDRAPRLVPNLESCRIVESDPKGHWDSRESILNVFLLPRIRTVSRNEFDPPRRLQFHRTSGNMRISEGEWRLEPLSGGKATRLRYEAFFAPEFTVPNFLIEQAASRDFPGWLRGIERESLADAQKR
jgi:ribosome-associated toxin RatA of RatAB toxin-antitoxin module